MTYHKRIYDITNLHLPQRRIVRRSIRETSDNLLNRRTAKETVLLEEPVEEQVDSEAELHTDLHDLHMVPWIQVSHTYSAGWRRTHMTRVVQETRLRSDCVLAVGE